MKILVNIRESYRKIVAVCDINLYGKCFVEGIRQLDVKKDFFGGEEKTKEDAIPLLKHLAKDDCTFNFVGKESVDAALKAGIISKKGIMTLKEIPFALSLL